MHKANIKAFLDVSGYTFDTLNKIHDTHYGDNDEASDDHLNEVVSCDFPFFFDLAITEEGNSTEHALSFVGFCCCCCCC
jgi:hypothetical protein